MNISQDIHDDIEPWLAASVHDQLSTDERAHLQEHLANCEACRALHQQETTMNQIITSALEDAKPDLAFEQRVLSGFRQKVPARSALVPLLANLLRFRATQIAAVAALLLTLVQVGRLVTHETAFLVEGLRQLPAVAGNAPAEMKSQERDQFAPGAKEDKEVRRELAAGAMSKSAVDARKPAAPLATTFSTGASDNVAALADAAKMQAEPPPPMFAEDSGDLAPLRARQNQNAETPNAPAETTRKLVRNAQVELEVLAFDEAVQKITAFAAETRGYVATSSSAKLSNGKLRGTVVVKVLPDTLDTFLANLRGLGELKNQTLGTDDVTKQYFDTDSRLTNARVMEQRLIEILKTKTAKVSDLLEVEKELGRVRATIEQMQGELKYLDAQVAFATVTVTLTEKDMDTPAAFLLKRRAQLALFSTDVEKTFADVKAIIDGAKAQVSSSTLDRDSTGEATARLVLLIVPEEADTLVARIKGMGRVQNYNEQTDRIAQGGQGMAEGAKVERDKVELSVVISRNEQEPALQTTTLSILTSQVGEKTATLKENALKAGAEIRSSTFNRDPNGQEYANVSLRVPMKNYAALLSSFNQLGQVKDVSVQRDDRRGTINEETAPADISIQVYSQPNIVADESGLLATVRRTLMQGVAALMWSLRMIGVALAFFAPWVLALAVILWIVRRVSRARKARAASKD